MTATACLLSALPLLLLSAAASASETVPVAGREFKSVVPAGDSATVHVDAFRLDRRPVTNSEFLAFVRAHPEWQRDRVAPLFADKQYLSHWEGPTRPGTSREHQPVTRVSWFAANAFCEAAGKRLPTWYEWEVVAAADRTRPDARDDAAWRQEILNWYAQPSGAALADVASGPANYYGVHDMHGLVWEWVLDFNSLLVSSDSREQGGADRLKFCGEAALSMADRENYAVLMRVAFLSSLEGSYTTGNLGFRCATDTR
jgi:formylglycine-generating enzyme required for sulfatase activity